MQRAGLNPALQFNQVKRITEQIPGEVLDIMILQFLRQGSRQHLGQGLIPFLQLRLRVVLRHSRLQTP